MKSTEKASKKNYKSPQLLTYGAIREITQSVGSVKMLDGGAIVGMRRSGIA
ncbi:hypothetical protein HUU40_04415 [candidate division KSB1 bacterium]|nr:hypothetical protein [candidate division KSB1 bacterium]